MVAKKKKVVRKLEVGEKLMNRIGIAANCFRSMRVRTRGIDLFAHLDKLKSAVRMWKQSHAFLSAGIVKQGEDCYYVIDENSSMNRDLANVHFLRIKSQLDEDLSKPLVDENLLIELVTEKCASEIILVDDQPEILWRLLVVEIKRGSVYEFVWQINHIISDGMSMSKNFIRLLDLIHRSIKSIPIETVDFGVYAGTEKIFAKELSAPLDEPKDVWPPASKPEFLDPEKSKANSQAHYDRFFSGKTKHELDKFNLIDLNSSERCFATLTELIQISRQVNFKRKLFDVSDSAFSNLLKK